jgi:lysophospholipase L1-like esterase
LNLGDLINDNFNRASLGADYTINGGASFVIVDNKLRISGTGAATNFSNNCLSTKATNSENFTANTVYKMNLAKNSLDYGLGFLLQSIGDKYKYSFYMLLDLSTGAGSGKLNIYSSTTANGSGFSSIHVSEKVLPVNIGDELEYKIIRKGNLYIFKASNNTLKDSVSYFLDSSLSNGFDPLKITNNVCKIGISKQGTSTATYDVSLLKVQRDLVKNRKFLFIGDSITFGYEAGFLSNRWVDMVFSLNNLRDKHTIYAQAGNVCKDYINNIAELSEFSSQYAVVMLGMNEAAKGVSLAVFQSDYASLISSLISSGKIPVLCLVTSNPSFDALILSYNNWIQATYGTTYRVIDTYRITKDIGYTGVHPTATGHKAISLIVYNEIADLI